MTLVLSEIKRKFELIQDFMMLKQAWSFTHCSMISGFIDTCKGTVPCGTLEPFCLKRKHHEQTGTYLINMTLKQSSLVPLIQRTVSVYQKRL